MSLIGEEGGYIPCLELAAALPEPPSGAIVGTAGAFVSKDDEAASSAAADTGALVGTEGGFVPKPCESGYYWGEGASVPNQTHGVSGGAGYITLDPVTMGFIVNNDPGNRYCSAGLSFGVFNVSDDQRSKFGVGEWVVEFNLVNPIPDPFAGISVPFDIGCSEVFMAAAFTNVSFNFGAAALRYIPEAARATLDALGTPDCAAWDVVGTPTSLRIRLEDVGPDRIASVGFDGNTWDAQVTCEATSELDWTSLGISQTQHIDAPSGGFGTAFYVNEVRLYDVSGAERCTRFDRFNRTLTDTWGNPESATTGDCS